MLDGWVMGLPGKPDWINGAKCPLLVCQIFPSSKVDDCSDKFLQACLACLKPGVGQIASKEFVSKPNPICVHNVTFTVIRNLA